MAGGGIYAKAAEKLQSIDAWLAENPNIKGLIDNVGGIAGGALWLRSLASRDPRGLLAVIAIDQAYEFVVNKIDFTIAQQQLSIYLQSKDKDLTAEQAQYLAKKGLKVAKEVGRFSTHAVTSKGYGLLRKEFGKLLDRKGVFKELSNVGKEGVKGQVHGGKIRTEVREGNKMQEASIKHPLSKNWGQGSLKEIVEKFAPGIEPSSNAKGTKLIFINKNTGWQVIHDKKRGYFRIKDREGYYLDLNGDRIHAPKDLRGKDAADYVQKNSHFKNHD